ncbi:MAG: cell wall hydrolase [Ruminococcaceae bacterium]|nr:cell wall hydrolase [Oscillospiraceae bacterium]
MSQNLSKSLINYVVFSFLFLTAVLFVGTQSVKFFSGQWMEEASAVAESEQAPIVIIDPGHGGEDGGAVGADGTLEKGLNLMISENIRDIFSLFGITAEMTREGDHMLYDYYNDLDDYTGKMKTYDLRNRLRIAEESGAVLYLGVHMNKFPKTQYSGMQVYYSPNHAEGGNAARMIREYARNFLQPDNKRETKRADSSIYILHRITIPAVLVECGFLSNEAECALLNTAEYRLKTACTVAAGSMEWLVNAK